MLRSRKHSRIRLRVCRLPLLILTASLPHLISAQLLQFNESNALPSCAYACAPLYQAQYACNASSASNGGSKSQWKCFCESEFVSKISGVVEEKGPGECDDVCVGEEEREQTNKWVKGRCDEVMGGMDINDTEPTPTPTPTKPRPKPTVLPIPPKVEGKEEKKPWLAKAWPFLVLALVLVLLPVLAFALYRYFNPYFKRRVNRDPELFNGETGYHPNGLESTAAMARRSSLIRNKSHRRTSSGRQYTTIPITDSPPVIPTIDVLAAERRRKENEGLLEKQRHENDFGGETLTDSDVEMGPVPPGRKSGIVESTRIVSGTSTARNLSPSSIPQSTPRVSPQLSPPAQMPVPVIVGSPPQRESRYLGLPPEMDLGDRSSIIPRAIQSAAPILSTDPVIGVDRQWSWDMDEEDKFEAIQQIHYDGELHPAYRDVDDYGAYPVGMQSEGGLRVVNAEVDSTSSTDGDWREGSSTASSSHAEQWDPETETQYEEGELEAMLGMPTATFGYSSLRTPLHTLMEEDEEGLSRESSKRSRRR